MNDSQESYEFEFEDDDDSNGQGSPEAHDDEMAVENAYYAAKATKEENIEKALSKFQEIANDVSSSGLRFKCFKQMTKIAFMRKEWHHWLEYYRKVLKEGTNVDPSYWVESISKMLDRYDFGKIDIEESEKARLFEQFHQETVFALTSCGTRNDRVLLKLYFTKVTFLKTLSKSSDHEILTTLEQMKVIASTAESVATKSSYLLDIIASEMEIYLNTQNVASHLPKLRQLYKQSEGLSSMIVHPRIFGLLKECGGVINLDEKKFEKASREFLGSFKSYEESVDHKRLPTLIRLIFTLCLSQLEVNPMQSEEFQSFTHIKRVMTMMKLMEIVENCDVDGYFGLKQSDEFQLALKDDELIAKNLHSLTELMRCNYLLRLLQPPSQFRMDELVQVLRLSNCEELADLILKSLKRGKLSPSRVKIDYYEKKVHVIEGRPLSVKMNGVSIAEVMKNLKIQKRKDDTEDLCPFFSSHSLRNGKSSTELGKESDHVGSWREFLTKSIPRTTEVETATTNDKTELEVMTALLQSTKIYHDKLLRRKMNSDK